MTLYRFDNNAAKPSKSTCDGDSPAGGKTRSLDRSVSGG
jgi:hypothetical protein